MNVIANILLAAREPMSYFQCNAVVERKKGVSTVFIASVRQTAINPKQERITYIDDKKEQTEKQ